MHPLLLLHNKFIPDIITYTFLVMAILTLLGWLATRRMDIYPNKIQNVMEVFVNSFHDLLIDTMGPLGMRFSLSSLR
jgi:F0F1-type ATP synthase membrane subunit a